MGCISSKSEELQWQNQQDILERKIASLEECLENVVTTMSRQNENLKSEVKELREKRTYINPEIHI